MDDSDDLKAWRRDAALLAEIGACLYGQSQRVKIVLPTKLAAAALAAWERHDTDAAFDPATESPEERAIRDKAGWVGLIGLAVEERIETIQGEQMVVELDAWSVGRALDAADEQGLLTSEAFQVGQALEIGAEDSRPSDDPGAPASDL